MRIAYFSDTYLPEVNGVTTTLTKLSGYLERKGIQHAFFTPEYEGAVYLPSSILRPGMSVFSEYKQIHRYQGVKVNISPNSRFAFPIPWNIFNICDDFAPDVVHVTTEFGLGHSGITYAKLRKLPLIMSFHTDYCEYLKYYNLTQLQVLIEFYMKFYYGFSNRMLVPSQYTMEQLKRKGFDNLGLWSRGIDTVRFSAGFRSEQVRDRLGIGGKFAFLYVGRISPEKGLNMFLRSIEEINRAYPGKAVFVFTGEGPFEDTIRSAGSENIIMTGFKHGSELSEIYASCDCFAQPSGTETFGNTCLEAMASGLPLAGVASGGVTDYLVHDKNALLSNSGDEAGFTKNLIRFMNDEQLRRRLANNGTETALSKDWDRVFNGLLEEYETVICENYMMTLKQSA